uniref:Uncharacterized protein n=1 Tax=Rhizophagus irregularis (strain DAOM 181602 / DAOM 197198 / MUCL 43194) TaxID=747089 RepID=U9U9Z5_RHIID
MISENKENDRNSHKLDDDGGGVDNGVHSIGIIEKSLYSIADIQSYVDRGL